MSQNLFEVIDQAFDYRGDVTLLLKDGRQVEGYVFNRDHQQKCLQLFVASTGVPQKISYNDLDSITFTGIDTAAGKSWEEWKAKKHATSKS